MEIKFGLRNRDDVDREPESLEERVWDHSIHLFFRRVEDDGEVEVAVGAVVSAGAGAEGDDLQGIGGGDDAADGFVDLFAGDRPVEDNGFVGHERCLGGFYCECGGRRRFCAWRRRGRCVRFGMEIEASWGLARLTSKVIYD